MEITESLTAENAAMAEAVAFSKKYGDPRWLLALGDHYIDSAMALATAGDEFRKEPDPLRAIVVPNRAYQVVEVRGDVVVDRPWMYVSDVGDLSPRKHEAGRCDRCDPGEMLRDKGPMFQPLEPAVYLPRGRFAVQFQFCVTCMTYYRAEYARLFPTES